MLHASRRERTLGPWHLLQVSPAYDTTASRRLSLSHTSSTYCNTCLLGTTQNRTHYTHHVYRGEASPEYEFYATRQFDDVRPTFVQKGDVHLLKLWDTAPVAQPAEQQKEAEPMQHVPQPTVLPPLPVEQTRAQTPPKFSREEAVQTAPTPAHLVRNVSTMAIVEEEPVIKPAVRHAQTMFSRPASNLHINAHSEPLQQPWQVSDATKRLILQQLHERLHADRSLANKKVAASEPTLTTHKSERQPLFDVPPQIITESMSGLNAHERAHQRCGSPLPPRSPTRTPVVRKDRQPSSKPIFKVYQYKANYLTNSAYW